jgi:hexosaminidase
MPVKHLLTLAAGTTLLAAGLTVTAVSPSTAGADRPAGGSASALSDVVPAPVSVRPAAHQSYRLNPGTVIWTEFRSAEARRTGEFLARILRPSTGYRLPVVSAVHHRHLGGIRLLLSGAGGEVGDEGYRLEVTPRAVTIRARSGAGLFAGVQTLRQLLPAKAESATRQPGPWTVPGGRIVDYPRYPHRGAMLDVARHFFTVDEVKRYIDEIALYKINHLHLHLADDQGWRIEIKTWPRLATYGGSTEVGGGPGGYYTQADYRALVAYARARHVTIVPEIDMPGHTNAALASYAELNCDGVAPPLYTGTSVGFSSLCIGKEITYRFVDDVVRELAALTPGPYLHIGGDEAHETPAADYVAFINRAQQIVRRHGKTTMGWHEITQAPVPPGTVAQFWWPNPAAPPWLAEAAGRGVEVVLSPANQAYLDMKYDPSTPLGLSWAAYIEVRDAYEWDPATRVAGLPATAVRGVEAPLWSETLETLDDIEFMAFPRLPAIAELGWSPAATHDWEAFRLRLAAQGPRWCALGVNFYRSPQVPWPACAPAAAGAVREAA